jgi:hypothetical protein
MSDVPADLRTFIQEHIGSILQLELLLLLAADPQKAWNAEEAAKELYVNPDAAYGFLEGMRVRGLFERLAPEDRFRFAPQNPESARLTAELASFYRERRLTVIDLIYASPTDRYQSFADAFRFRRPK